MSRYLTCKGRLMRPILYVYTMYIYVCIIIRATVADLMFLERPCPPMPMTTCVVPPSTQVAL